MRVLLALLILLVPLYAQETSGTEWTQIKSSDRHGTQGEGQASDGTGATGKLPMFSADGSLTDSGFSASSVGSSPLSTKGDLYTFSTVNTRLPIGTNGQFLWADSTQTTGNGWHTLVSGDIPAIPESGVTGLISDLAGKVPTTRTISTTAPLTGGGDLSANRTFAIDAFTGDSGSGGLKGAVPAPAAGDAAAGKFLSAGGGFSVPATSGGTVTSIATTGPITGGTITSTGTIACPTCVTSSASLTSGQLLKGSGSQGLQVGDLSGDVMTSGSTATTIAANAVTSAKSAVVNTRRVCSIVIGTDNATAVLVDADLAPQGRQCFVPFAATIVEVTVAGNAGTPNVVVAKNHAGSLSDSTSSALATASAGALACSNTGGTTGLDGTTTCSATLQNTSLAAGDWIETHTATAGGTAKRMSIAVTYTVN